MDSVIDKLTEIEQAASAIVAHAEEEKEKLDREYEARRKQFDQELEEKTMARIDRIREELEHDKEHLLTGQEESSRELIASIQEEYDTKHTEYAEHILKRITEV